MVRSEDQGVVANHRWSVNMLIHLQKLHLMLRLELSKSYQSEGGR